MLRDRTGVIPCASMTCQNILCGFLLTPLTGKSPLCCPLPAVLQHTRNRALRFPVRLMIHLWPRPSVWRCTRSGPATADGGGCGFTRILCVLSDILRVWAIFFLFVIFGHLIYFAYRCKTLCACICYTFCLNLSWFKSDIHYCMIGD